MASKRRERASGSEPIVVARSRSSYRTLVLYGAREQISSAHCPIVNERDQVLYWIRAVESPETPSRALTTATPLPGEIVLSVVVGLLWSRFPRNKP